MPISLKSILRSSCASQASTAICTTTATPPRPLRHRLIESSSSAFAAAYRKSFSSKKRPSVDGPHQEYSARRHSSAEVTDWRRKSSADIRDAPRRSNAGPSRRYLLCDTASFGEDLQLLYRKDTDLLALEKESVSEAVKPGFDSRSTCLSGVGNGRSGFNQRGVVKPFPPPTAPSGPQVVVLRVSLHCRGCEGKLRKHISKMQGVTSFDIDFEMKKVTVTGNVTPLYVLNNITKVKNAQFWPSPTTSTSSSSSSGSSTSEFSY